MIPYGHQSIDEADVAAVLEVLKSDWLTQGPKVAEFEAAITAATGARHAVAFVNGTAALHGACAAAGVGAGQTLATSTLSFSASANCGRYVGAGVHLLDVDPDTLNVDPEAIPAGLDAFVAVHFTGLPMDLSRLEHRPRVVIEDAAHALGADTPDGPVGNCAHSDMTTFSFHAVKAATTGEGGAVTTNSDELADRLRRFRNHGLVRHPELGGWYQAVEELGFNYRITDLQAALGVGQMAKLTGFVQRRCDLAQRYRELLRELPLTLPPAPPPGFSHAYHLFAVQVPRRREVFEAMREAGIGVQVHYVPIHQHPAYQGSGPCPNADAVYAGLLSLPLFPDLSEAEQDVVVAALESSL